LAQAADGRALGEIRPCDAAHDEADPGANRGVPKPSHHPVPDAHRLAVSSARSRAEHASRTSSLPGGRPETERLGLSSHPLRQKCHIEIGSPLQDREAELLLSVTGASGAGKSTPFEALNRAFEGQLVTCVEFDALGVPPNADTAWRHGAVERWVQRARDEQRVGRHLVLCGQVPVGELLAAPSADILDGLAACVLHCSPEVRRERLVARGDDPNAVHDHLTFGEWFHRHTLDPSYQPEVIQVPSPVAMRWDRWTEWRAGDPRWAFEVIDTDGFTREEVAARVVARAQDTLSGRRQTPLAGAWWSPR
jgi:hypothetical protein